MSYTNINISKKYAKVLFDLSCPDKIEKIESLFSNFLVVFESIKEFFLNPVTEIGKRQEVLNTALANFEGDDKEFADFIRVVFENKRQAFLPQIFECFKEEIKTYKKIASVSITLAKEVSSEKKDRIVSKIKEKLQKEVSVTWKIDPEIIGGIIVKYNDKLLNASIKGHLQKITKELVSI